MSLPAAFPAAGPAVASLSPRLRTLLAQSGSFALAGLLLYLALRGVDLHAVWQALRDADYRWLAPLVAIVLLSHLARAFRWKLLLEALPPETPDALPRRVSLKTAFYSVMIGYMVNYAAPRLGEVARSANIASRERIRISRVLGTVVIERVLDMIVLALGLVAAFFLLADRLSTLRQLFLEPLMGRTQRVPALLAIVLIVGVAALVTLIFRQILTADDSRLQRLWHHRVRPMMASFAEGLLSVLQTRRRAAVALSTVFIWCCYLLMAHLPFVMLGMAAPYHLSLVDSWSIMVLGALGVVVPSPGGTGSYHYITIQTLVHLFAVSEDPAASYAMLTWAAQFLLYTLTGFVCLVLQGSSLRSLAAATTDARRVPTDAEPRATTPPERPVS